MDGQIRSQIWLPVVVTVIVWIALIFVIDALVSRMWADLFGLFYLMASPVIYRALKSISGVDVGGTDSNRGRSPEIDAGS